MSTRTNIIIEHGATRVYLYRHHDGYLAGAGADLARAVNAANGDAAALLVALLAERYDKQSYEPEPRAIYELTDCIHGDIEYLYRVSIGAKFYERPAPVEIGYAQCAIGSERPLDAACVVLNTLATFVNVVNADIRAQNKRLAALQRQQPGAFYGDMTPEPEVALA